jgi:hypothetical protein
VSPLLDGAGGGAPSEGGGREAEEACGTAALVASGLLRGAAGGGMAGGGPIAAEEGTGDKAAGRGETGGRGVVFGRGDGGAAALPGRGERTTLLAGGIGPAMEATNAMALRGDIGSLASNRRLVRIAGNRVRRTMRSILAT